MLHQGIPLSFRQSFNLAADHVKVVEATEHGLLIVDLTREVPRGDEAARRIQINPGVEPSAPKPANEQKQIHAGAKNAA